MSPSASRRSGLRIATWNLRKGGADRTHWRRLIEEHGADILLAQESYSPVEHLSGSPWAGLARNAVWAPAGANRWGSAVWSRLGRVRPLEVKGFAGWAAGALATGLPTGAGLGRRAAVFSVHVPHGPGGYQGQAQRLMEAVSGAADGARLVVGRDFNVPVNDSLQPNRPSGPRAFQWDAVHRFGLVNCWRAAHPGAEAPQTLRWSRAPEVPYSCDGLFVSAAARGVAVSCRVLTGRDWSLLSDHNPMVVELLRATP